MPFSILIKIKHILSIIPVKKYASLKIKVAKTKKKSRKTVSFGESLLTQYISFIKKNINFFITRFLENVL